VSDSESRIVTAGLLVIGDEILSGRTKDQNIATVAERLTAVGIRLREVRVVADDEAAIVAAVDDLRRRYTYLFTTGGIGPTHDDITADSIARAFGVAIDVDPRAVALMKPYYESRGLELTPARLRMARIPSGAELVANSVSVAPGFRLDNVIVMAGVPRVMQAMLEEVLPRLATGARMLSRSIEVARPESEIAEILAAHQRASPDVSMGSYPWYRDGQVGTELVLRSIDAQRLEHVFSELRLRLSEHSLI
jgi:molybdenum cofactor synthesis domain-containing protein